MRTILIQRSALLRLIKPRGHRQKSAIFLSRTYDPSAFTNYVHNKRHFGGSSENNEYSTKSVWQQLQSPPNIITLARMASTPLLAYWVCSEQYELAILGCSLAAISDALDGYLAKNYNWSTTVGTYLDPVSDKVLINTLAISLWYSGMLPTPLIVLWGTKDAALLSGTAYMLHQKYDSINFFTTSLNDKPLTVTPSIMGKVNTALQFATIGVAILMPVTTSFSPMLLDSLCWATGATTIGSCLSYMTKSAFYIHDKKTNEDETDDSR